MDELTPKQKSLLDHLKDYAQEFGQLPAFRDIAKHFSCAIGTVQDHMKALEEKGFLSRLPDRVRSLRLSEKALGIPVYGRVHAGLLHAAFGQVESYLMPTPGFTARGELFALMVQGDSMEGAGILEGDMAVVRKQQTAEDGDIVVALKGDEATLKRLRRVRKDVFLEPANPAYKSISAQGSVILGKVVQIQRKYR